MSLTGNRDMDLIIMRKLHTKDLLVLCQSNKYFQFLCESDAQLQKRINKNRKILIKKYSLRVDLQNFAMDYLYRGPLKELVADEIAQQIEDKFRKIKKTHPYEDEIYGETKKIILKYLRQIESPIINYLEEHDEYTEDEGYRHAWKELDQIYETYFFKNKLF